MTNRPRIAPATFSPRLLENLVRCSDCTHGAAFHHNASCNAGGCSCTTTARAILAETLRRDGRRRNGRFYTIDEPST
jgi:hypothetical protein